MKIAIIGAGAVGGYFGGRLAVAGNDMIFLARGKTLEALRASPLRVNNIKGDLEVGVAATNEPAEIDAQVVLVAGEAWQGPETAAADHKTGEAHTVIDT